MSEHTAIPDSWHDRESFAVTNPGQPWTPLHREALAACRRNAAAKPRDCICCGCHTDNVHESIPDDRLRLMIDDAACPAERRALQRALANR